jgi:hypothetical protein
MRKDSLFIAHQIARFGAMTFSQLEFACQEKCTRSTIYRILNDLAHDSLIDRTLPKAGSQHLFTPTRVLYEQIYGDDHKRATGVNKGSILHAVDVAGALLALSRYQFVTGILTEHEIHQNDFEKFCHARVPDGIIQISNADHSFDLAVEVERSRKTESRIDEILEKYKYSFLKGMPCSGLLLLVKDQVLLDLYETRTKKVLPEFEKQILITTLNDLSKLNERYFGELKSTPQGSLEKIGILSQGRSIFSPMISTKESTNRDPKALGVARQSQI